MALFCSCGHNRLEHLLGDRLSDNRVQMCQVQNCTCGKYHGRYDNDNGYVYKSLFRAVAFLAVGFAFFAFTSYAIDYLVSGYEIQPIKTEETTFLVYENGTRVNEPPTKIDYKQQLGDNLKSMIAIADFFAMYVLGAIFLFTSYDYDKRKIINSK